MFVKLGFYYITLAAGKLFWPLKNRDCRGGASQRYWVSGCHAAFASQRASSCGQSMGVSYEPFGREVVSFHRSRKVTRSIRRKSRYTS